MQLELEAELRRGHEVGRLGEDHRFSILPAPSSLKPTDIASRKGLGVVCSHFAFVKVQMVLFDRGPVDDETAKFAYELLNHIKYDSDDTHGPRKQGEVCHELVLSSLLSAALQNYQSSLASSVDIPFPTFFWCHQMQVGAGKMDLCGYQRVDRGWCPRVVWEVSIENFAKDSQLFGYVNNLDIQQATGHGLFVIGIILVISTNSYIAVKAFYKAVDGGDYKLAVVELFSERLTTESVTRVLTAIQYWLSIPYSNFMNVSGTPPPSLHQRNVNIHDGFVTKVFDYRRRFVEVTDRRKHEPSVRYIPNCKVVVDAEDLVIIQYPYIEGNHLPRSVKEVIGVLRSLIVVHKDGNLHMDIRASNLVFSSSVEGGRGGAVIDYDFCSTAEASLYPANFCIDIHDGLRHPEVACNKCGTIEHDCFSLASVLKLCSPDNSDFNDNWLDICNLIEKCELSSALDIVKQCQDDYLLSSTLIVVSGVGTGSPNQPQANL